MASEWRRSQADGRGFLERLPMYGGKSYGTGSLVCLKCGVSRTPLADGVLRTA